MYSLPPSFLLKDKKRLESLQLKRIKSLELSFIAKGYACNVLEKDSLETAHQQILSDFGKCDLLINGAGGNHPAATTENEFHHLVGVLSS